MGSQGVGAQALLVPQGSRDSLLRASVGLLSCREAWPGPDEELRAPAIVSLCGFLYKLLPRQEDQSHFRPEPFSFLPRCSGSISWGGFLLLSFLSFLLLSCAMGCG